ncbi:MAG: hypothetical protein BAJALOKI3v1_1040005 [Promethearchaeota archaeon]|nr:MAG: hypothetical protein BAJALOKI3v1_1040005 [Candidatus Lokiarchaeota archaeon]
MENIIKMGKIDDIPPSELMEYQDVIDFLTLFYANKERVDIDLITRKARQVNLESTLRKLLELEIY